MGWTRIKGKNKKHPLLSEFDKNERSECDQRCKLRADQNTDKPAKICSGGLACFGKAVLNLLLKAGQARLKAGQARGDLLSNAFNAR